ncbi:hypothetical protein THAOC_14484 [Thalassiosira oceanica]|uniref:ER membrane protein complex subunit 2 n=1 Tax=Thalassiosira oceanica TaxID=159749 RepID=K0SUS2_THAOC|nr:hypothetical protein THAOC_14484 [Thalassiosira oceanica]|eukprot:EJK64751.1 hypothetical protein THAOC_14484 [Thalassiosira oceanica]
MQAAIGPEDDLPTLVRARDDLGALRYIRAHKLRQPVLVLNHGKRLLGLSDEGRNIASGSRKVTDSERLSALEQLCVASLDLGKTTLAESCLDSILEAGVAKDSARYRKLLAMCCESSGDYDGATAIYDKLLEENPSNGYAAKRKYCILAAQSDKQEEAANAMNEYLSNNSGDVSAWNEMAELCLNASDFQGAAYCYEEVVLGCPLDSTVHMRLGEAYCTAGGLENTKLARKHLAQACQLEPNNLRAWYGLVSAAESYLDEVSQLGKSKREDEGDGVEVARALIEYAGSKLIQSYRKSSSMSKIVEIVLRESAENNTL